MHRYLYAYGNPEVYIDLNGNASILASGQEFDDFGYELYQQGNHLGAAFVTIGGAFYKAGTGFFSLGLFDEANQAITDNDTYGGATKQFGNSIKQTAKDVATEYVEEGAASAVVGVAGKFACGRFRQACDVAIDTAKKFGDKFNTDVKINKESASRAGVVEKPIVTQGGGNRLEIRNKVAQTIPNAEKKLLAIRKYKETQGITGKLTSEQYYKFRRGNAGENGAEIYARKGDNIVSTPTISTNQKHHLFTKELHAEFKGTLPAGYKRDHGQNLIDLPTPFHGNHPSYTNRVREGFNEMRGKGPITMDGMKSFQNSLKSEIESIKNQGEYDILNNAYKDQGF